MDDVYFNEHDAYPAAWLRNLWPGATVDERSVVDVQPADLAGYRRVHLFAGIGGWEYALTLAGWPEDREAWTGSCPCQPFSGAGRNDGVLDSRHLWPAFHRLIAECRPAIVFGEQVASAAGRAWLAGVRTDLEDLGYAVGAADLCAASCGAPHIRQRLYWVADATGSRPAWGEDGRTDSDDAGQGRRGLESERGGKACRLEYAEHGRSQGRRPENDGRVGRSVEGGATSQAIGSAVEESGGGAGRVGDPASGGRREQRDAPREGRSGHAEFPSGAGSLVGGMGESDGAGREPGRQGIPSMGYGRAVVAASGVGRVAESDGRLSSDGDLQRGREHGQQPEDGRARFWDAYDLLPCRDGKARRVEPGSFPLAHGVPARMGRLRAYGNAIIPEIAAEFVRAWMETRA
jgi:DNA (cytosine-5)-methyltransferase 1